ncbi:tRNA (guanine(37)-N(1))-methyltransferase [hydrothermal vent metagenome]|uniref:tRNA (guanine-N(1)-)-methyltransferase n=1 Tax=hydrothermal vent metagenome TaxID=652676 RepID=A0A3B1CU44_9ZZZZ
MRCDVITLFPELIRSALGESILKRAQANALLDIQIHQLRDFAVDKHHTTDDVPYGGGGGMLLKPEPIFAAVEKVKSLRDGAVRIIIPSPQGKIFNQKMAENFSQDKRTLVFICGHYEGIDARVAQGIEIEEVSLGDYILTGGELPAVTMIDAAARLLPGVLGGATSALHESFEDSLLEHPHYTRPYEFRGMQVPEVLLSGNHGAIRDWRRAHAIINTQERRPDLLTEAVLSPDEKQGLPLGPCLMED